MKSRSIKSEYLSDASFDEIVDEYLQLTTRQASDEEIIKACHDLYELAELDKPEVYIADDPFEAQVFGNLIVNEDIDQVNDKVRDKVWDKVRDKVREEGMEYIKTGYYPNYSDYGWTSYLEYFDRYNIVELDNNWRRWLNIIKTGIFDTIQFEDICIVVRCPETIQYSEDGIEDGFSVIFPNDGERYLYLNNDIVSDEEIIQWWQDFDGNIDRIHAMMRLTGKV